MEPEGSSPHSQTTRHLSLSCARLIQSMSPNSLLEDSFQYYPPIYAWVLQVFFFQQVSPPKPHMHLSPSPYVLHTLPIAYNINRSYNFWTTRGLTTILCRRSGRLTASSASLDVLICATTQGDRQSRYLPRTMRAHSCTHTLLLHATQCQMLPLLNLVNTCRTHTHAHTHC